jgi:hypothetical protein
MPRKKATGSPRKMVAPAMIPIVRLADEFVSI